MPQRYHVAPDLDSFSALDYATDARLRGAIHLALASTEYQIG